MEESLPPLKERRTCCFCVGFELGAAAGTALDGASVMVQCLVVVVVVVVDVGLGAAADDDEDCLVLLAVWL
jgi:hypothetical protein